MVRGVQVDPERLEVRLLLQRAPIRGARVLEIGSGDGRSARRFARYARSFVGVDPETAQIERAKRLLPAHLREKVRFEVGDAERLRFKPGAIDVVVFSLSL